ncbi:hypothetical protein [Vreelandella sp. GE22]
MYEIEPYISVGPLSFGFSQKEVKSLLGDPVRTSTNRKGEKDFHYFNAIARFSSINLTLIEVGITPSASALIKNINLYDDPDALNKLVMLDGTASEYYGFIVFFNLGITMTGFHDGDDSQKAVTAFTRGRWNHLREDMQPFYPDFKH